MRMTVSGDARRTRSTKSATVFALWTVAVGVFGLLKKTRPAPLLAAAIIGSTSSLRLDSTLTSTSACFSCLATLVQFSKVGDAVTSARDGDVNARTALFRISCEPAPRTTFSGLVLNFAARAATRSVSPGVLLNG